MYKPKYFTMTELTVSSTAKSYGISNEPTEEHRMNLLALCEYVLDPLRELWGGPLYVSSGYRSLALNNKIRELGCHASYKSYHMLGLAADIKAGTSDDNRRLFEMLRQSSIPFRQIIDEEGYRWIHIAYDPNDAVAKRQVLRGRSGVYTTVK